MAKIPHCINCDEEGHYRINCTKSRVRIAQHGKYARKWAKTRAKWYRLNLADHYSCYICGKWLSREETSIDHILPRSSHPELRYEMSNLAPCCVLCNHLKGSKHLNVVVD